MTESAQQRIPFYASSTPAGWIIAISLLVLAINSFFRTDNSSNLLPPAVAQSVSSGGARGIFAFTGPITPNTFGLYMVDTDAGTLWCYEIVTVGGIKRLRLVAARSWIFDRYLEDYNIDDLTPSAVEAMVKEQRQNSAATNPEK
ncbi:MAG: hypothetical protein HJJLKODD_01096 [Phycisphaerae bacterium]|nr:hypothetical protein [Phycisphaerae bacterium]